MCAEKSESCKSESCCCHQSGPQIRGFLIPCLLLLLNEGDAHGYQLIESLGGLDYLNTLPDSGVIYRHLRKLEQEEMISSSLQEGEGGPARKVYSLCEKGRDCLYTWKAGFKNLKKNVDGIVIALDNLK